MRVIVFSIVMLIVLSGCENNDHAGHEIESLRQELVQLEQSLQTSQKQWIDSVEQRSQLQAQLEDQDREIEKLKQGISMYENQLSSWDWQPIDGGNDVFVLEQLGNNEGIRTMIELKRNGGIKISTDWSSMSMVTIGDVESFDLVQLNTDDGIIQLAFSVRGSGGMGATYFFYYNSDLELFEHMGSVSGMLSEKEITIHGDGTVIVHWVRGKLLYTWFHEQTYRLDDRYKLIPVTQDLYDMPPEKLTAKQDYTLHVSRTERTPSLNIKEGDEITLVATDNIEWVKIRTADGREGWIAIENFNTIRSTDLYFEDVFEGNLIHAG